MERKNKNGWKTLSSSIVYKNPFYKIQKDDLIFPDGREGEYFIVKIGAAVFIVPVKNGKIIFVKQYRYVFDDWFLELPGGGVSDNVIIEAASKELHEETGYKAGAMQEIGKFTSVSELMDEETHVFVAKDLKNVGQKLESSEEGMEVVEIEIDKAYKMIEDGEMKDGQTIAALMLAKKYII
jgi:8-oxo-dGTP pyrophosphatase MutT (NUDIX family)